METHFNGNEFDLGNPVFDNKLTELINSSTDIVDKYLGFQVLEQQKTFKDYINLYSRSIVLPFFPVNSISTLKLNGSTLDTNNYFLLNNDGIIKLSMFYEGESLVECDYSTGWKNPASEMLSTDKPVPSDIISAVKSIVMWRWQVLNTSSFGIKNQVQMDVSTSYERDIPPYVLNILNKYRRS